VGKVNVNVEEVVADYGRMEKGVKDMMAKVLAEWLSRDFEILIDEPSEKEIAETLEEHDGKEVLEDGVKKR
jgi:hypothetical protein